MFHIWVAVLLVGYGSPKRGIITAVQASFSRTCNIVHLTSQTFRTFAKYSKSNYTFLTRERRKNKVLTRRTCSLYWHTFRFSQPFLFVFFCRWRVGWLTFDATCISVEAIKPYNGGKTKMAILNQGSWWISYKKDGVGPKKKGRKQQKHQQKGKGGNGRAINHTYTHTNISNPTATFFSSYLYSGSLQ